MRGAPGASTRTRPLGEFSPLLVLPSPSWGSGLPGASFSLLFSPEESQLSHSLPVSHSGGRTESETSADAQGFQLPQRTGPGHLQEPPGKRTLPFQGAERWDMNLGFCYSPATQEQSPARERRQHKRKRHKRQELRFYGLVKAPGSSQP